MASDTSIGTTGVMRLPIASDESANPVLQSACICVLLRFHSQSSLQRTGSVSRNDRRADLRFPPRPPEWLWLVLSTGLLLLNPLPLFAAPQQRPNILWISCEDMSPDLGCYGDRYAVTPNLDRLASQGVRYTRVFGHAGVCAVNRTGIITAMYPTTIGTQHMRCEGVPPPHVKCFPEYLRAAGYYCTNNVKTDYNFAAPVTAWDENSNKAHWRNRPDKRQPFFAVFNITTTHESQIRLPAVQFAKRTARLTAADRHDPAQAVLPPYYPDTPIVRRDWANYHDLITAMDKEVADILRQLDEDGLADETVVFFWSDHGRGLPRAKRWIYDSGLHVPLIVRWPGKLPAGTTNDDLVALLDLGPTALSIAGVKVPEYMQGRAFLGTHKGPPREYIFAGRDRMDEAYDLIRAVRDRRYKYIRNFEPHRPYAQPISYMDQMPTMQELRRLDAAGKLTGPQTLFFRKTKPIEELYDTANDPHEIVNLADSPQHQEILRRLRHELERWQTETNDLGLVPEAVLWERLRPGGVFATTAAPALTPAPGFNGRPVVVTATCATEGASIAYTAGAGKNPRWLLYTGPITVDKSTLLRFKACRLGYKDSPVVEVRYEIAGN